jgi:hypothetical protein
VIYCMHYLRFMRCNMPCDTQRYPPSSVSKLEEYLPAQCHHKLLMMAARFAVLDAFVLSGHAPTVDHQFQRSLLHCAFEQTAPKRSSKVPSPSPPTTHMGQAASAASYRKLRQGGSSAPEAWWHARCYKRVPTRPPTP